jgi:hypothetical protein
LFILIAAIALWTDAAHLSRDSQNWPAALFVVSILGLAASLVTFVIRKPAATKILLVLGVGLAFLGTVLDP